MLQTVFLRLHFLFPLLWAKIKLVFESLCCVIATYLDLPEIAAVEREIASINALAADYERNLLIANADH